jgi:hypothetical protein
MDSLRKWNIGAALLHTTAAILAATLLTNKKDRQVTVYRSEYDKDVDVTSRVDLPAKLVPESNVDIKYIVVAFFAITAVSHALYATDFLGRGWYSKAVLGFGWNPFRWIEYSLSATIMVYLISIVSGTKDQVSAISAALITPGLMINGFTLERALRQNEVHAWSLNEGPKPNIDSDIIYSNLIPAWFLFGVKWYIILSNFSRFVQQAKEAGKPIDTSVVFMVFSQLFFFSLFGVIQTYQVWRWSTLHKGRKEPSYASYEKAYIILSSVTKLLLAGTVAYAIR